MKKPAAFQDWRNKSRVAAKGELEKKAELFAALERYVRDNGGWIVSAPSEKPARFEAMHGSPLPAKLQDLGWKVRHLGTSTRILPSALVETYTDHTAPGRPTLTRCHAGPVEVCAYELKP
jgi:hypothetical protein